MTVSEILEQVKTLGPQERKELAKHLIDMIDEPVPVPADKSQEHWGRYSPTNNPL